MISQVATVFLIVCVAFVAAEDAPAALTLRSNLQMAGFQGQSFSVDAQPNTVYNFISSPFFQFNGLVQEFHFAGFPAIVLTQLGFLVGDDVVIVSAGTAEAGMTVTVNGKTFSWLNMMITLGSGRKMMMGNTHQNSTIELKSSSELSINTDDLKITIINQDGFFVMSVGLKNKSLLTSGRRTNFAKNAGSSYANDVAASQVDAALHGLVGQTWKHVVYTNGSNIQGCVNDYKVDSLTGTNSVYNKYITLQ